MAQKEEGKTEQKRYELQVYKYHEYKTSLTFFREQDSDKSKRLG